MNARTAISTEGRVFTAQLTRDLAARQAAGANLLAPGTKLWPDAFRKFTYAVYGTKSPTKAAKEFKRAVNRLIAAQNDHRACFVNCFMGRSRSAYIEVETYEVGKHPLTKAGNDGISVAAYFCSLQRNGRLSLGSSQHAFISWHALGRMWERSEVDIFSAKGVVAACGIVGNLMRESDKHINTEINLAVSKMICTGVLRHAPDEEKRVTYGFYDVLTVLPPVEDRFARKIAQGMAIAQAVRRYVKADDADPRGYADDIAVIPFHETDYVSRELRA